MEDDEQDELEQLPDAPKPREGDDGDWPDDYTPPEGRYSSTCERAHKPDHRTARATHVRLAERMRARGRRAGGL